MSSRAYYMVLGAAEHLEAFEDYEEEHSIADQWFWTVPQDAKVGETCFVYLCAPVSRVVGRVEIVSAPFYNIEMIPEFKDKWMAEVGWLHYFEPRPELTIRGLRQLFPDWGWPRYPRNKTRIPPGIVEPFLELVGRGRHVG